MQGRQRALLLLRNAQTRCVAPSRGHRRTKGRETRGFLESEAPLGGTPRHRKRFVSELQAINTTLLVIVLGLQRTCVL